MEIKAENDWKNGLVLWPLPPAVVTSMPRVLRSWVRNYLMCVGLFIGIAAVWAYYIYFVFGAVLFKGKIRPTSRDMAAQVWVWLGAIPLYAVMPAGIEWAAEAGWTRAYSRVGDVGIVYHVAYFVLFMAAVEAGVWAIHRWLHTQAFYRALHHVHHVYNKQGALSPFAGLAFHPLDGIMQASPYCVALLVIPTHFTTFELLLLATGIWTTNIHDTVDGKVPPLLGAGYHCLHHITYRHNFGHYTTYMDWLMGTLLSPEDYDRQRSQTKQIKEVA